MNELLLSGDQPAAMAFQGDLRATGAAHWIAHLPISAQTYRIDLSAIEAVDSAGLALLVHWQQQLQQAGGQLMLQSTPDSLLRLARISGVATLLSIDPQQAENTEL